MSDTSTKVEETQAKPDASKEVTIVNVKGDSGEKTLETELTFTMDWVDSETGKKVSGTFTAQRPNLGAVQRIAVIKARLNGGERVTADIDFLNEMMAYCSVVLKDTPKWWTPETFFTADPVRAIWDHVRSWENSFRNRGVGK